MSDDGDVFNDMSMYVSHLHQKGTLTLKSC